MVLVDARALAALACPACGPSSREVPAVCEPRAWLAARGGRGAALEPLWGEGDFVTDSGPYRFASGGSPALGRPPRRSPPRHPSRSYRP
jgi:hypothetical protein